ncbi:Fur-regulated basic protein FbpA (plasmid) [Bacillus carboniphilus]|uniref:Fur-regulated basic protein FbpA n=1 Tax=Bacillus carboniphilus TaxID=86663 RepID=A0ABY9K3H0_9BACI|nr:Fur-regulated basic protein FbpA [Bacillus carboniphilus]WLR44461.1 Fur-regulated basic protein FbpA [Bacillus carboniphilus]
MGKKDRECQCEDGRQLYELTLDELKAKVKEIEEAKK